MTADSPVTVSERRYAEELALVQARLGSEAWKKIDAVDEALATLPPREMPLRHTITHDAQGKPNAYLREIYIPKHTLLTTRIHLTEHPLILAKGVVSIWTDDEGVQTLHAYLSFVTKPGTRRILFTHEDCILCTFHVTDKSDPDEIVMDVTYTGGKFAKLGAAAAHPQLA